MEAKNDEILAEQYRFDVHPRTLVAAKACEQLYRMLLTAGRKVLGCSVFHNNFTKPGYTRKVSNLRAQRNLSEDKAVCRKLRHQIRNVLRQGKEASERKLVDRCREQMNLNDPTAI